MRSPNPDDRPTSDLDDEAARLETIARVLSSFDAACDAREGAEDALIGAPPVVGYDLDRPFVFEEFIASLAGTGFQATALGEAIRIVRQMRDLSVPIYLGVTSNIGTCGLRDNLTFLIKHRHIRGLAATAGAIEEDVMKVLLPFVLGQGRQDDAQLWRQSVSRTGNILIPGNRYAWLHMVLWTLHRRLLRTVLATTPSIGVLEYVAEIGHQLEVLDIPGRESSFVYQAWRNHVGIFCPALLDGAIGDVVYHLRRANPGFVMDMSRCHQQLIEDMMVASAAGDTLGLIAVGGSVPKHMLCNSAIYSGGASHAVYINTATESDGSNAGASTSEAVSWGKIRPDARAVRVQAEATLVFPLLLAACFQTYTPQCSPPRDEEGP